MNAPQTFPVNGHRLARSPNSSWAQERRESLPVFEDGIMEAKP